jgi:adenine-specific DNA-methyltransferase
MFTIEKYWHCRDITPRGTWKGFLNLRYLGNKDSLITTLKEKILSKVDIKPDDIFFDAFCGTGSVANAFKDICDLTINDNLNCATTYAYGRMVAANCTFDLLGFNPFEFFNSNDETIEGFFYKTYSPGGVRKNVFIGA